jgi:hypothetical protein
MRKRIEDQVLGDRRPADQLDDDVDVFGRSDQLRVGVTSPCAPTILRARDALSATA